MWNSLKDHPLFSIVDALHTILGSLVLFFAACVLGYMLTTFDLHSYNSISEFFIILPFASFFPLIMSAIGLFGIPFLLVHFWTLYHLLYTDGSRINLFFVAFVTHAAICISVAWFSDFSESWLRSLISIAVLVAAYVMMKKLNLFPNDTSNQPMA